MMIRIEAPVEVLADGAYVLLDDHIQMTFSRLAAPPSAIDPAEKLFSEMYQDMVRDIVASAEEGRARRENASEMRADPDRELCANRSEDPPEPAAGRGLPAADDVERIALSNVSLRSSRNASFRRRSSLGSRTRRIAPPNRWAGVSARGAP